jgi:predicted AAA+ superfamily ATPase
MAANVSRGSALRDCGEIQNRMLLLTKARFAVSPAVLYRDLFDNVRAAARTRPVVVVTGPRQSGKSTLCRHLFPDHPRVDLGRPDVCRSVREDPVGFLMRCPSGAIIEDAHLCPDLLPYLRDFVGRDPTPGRWILTSSHAQPLFAPAVHAMGGHAGVLQLLPLSRNEIVRFPVFPSTLDDAILQGGYPWLADRGRSPTAYLDGLIAAIVERDVRGLKNISNWRRFQRFLSICAGRTAQTLNYAALAADAGVSQPTGRIWVALLEAVSIVFRIPAFTGDRRRRLARMPKLHFHDTGLACRLLGIADAGQLRSHPLRGALFETWVASELVKHRRHHGLPDGVRHYRDHRGTAVPIVVERGDVTTLVDAKPGLTVTSDMLEGIERVLAARVGGARVETAVVHGGDQPREREGIRIVPWTDVTSIVGD